MEDLSLKYLRLNNTAGIEKEMDGRTIKSITGKSPDQMTLFQTKPCIHEEGTKLKRRIDCADVMQLRRKNMKYPRKDGRTRARKINERAADKEVEEQGT